MSLNNKLLHQKRQSYHKQIRRQYIETFTKNRRKKLLEENESYSSYFNQNKQCQKQMEYQNYLSSLSFMTFQQDPNSHLQYIVEILSHEDSKVYKKWIGDLLIMVERYVMVRLEQQRGKIEYIKSLVVSSDIKEGSQLMNDFIVNILVFNQVFFEPLSQYKQTYFSIDSEGQNKSNKGIKQKSVSKAKLNLYLVLDFFLTISYQITPDIFVSCLRENVRKNKNDLSNGYDQMAKIIKNTQFQPIKPNNQEQHFIKLFISVFNNIYNISIQLIKFALNIRYQTGSLEKLWNILYQIYNNSELFMKTNTIMKPTQIPTVFFDKQKMFVRESVRNDISLRCFHVIVNMTAMVTMNEEFDSFVDRLMILNELECIVQQIAFNREEIKLILDLYANLVEQQILESGKGMKIKNQSRIEEQRTNQEIMRQPPGVYTSLLQVIVQTSSNAAQINNIVYILKTILQHYQVPPKQQNLNLHSEPEFQNTSSSQLVLSLYHCQNIASILHSLFHKIFTQQYELSHLSNLFVLVAQKMLPYLMYLHELTDILQLVIKNQNKRIFSIQSNQNKSKLNTIISETQQKQKAIITQNLKTIIKQCNQLIKSFKYDFQHFSYNQSNAFNPMSLDYSNQTIPRDFIDSIIDLWQQNQIQYCYSEFIHFIDTALQCFPQHLILSQNKKTDQQFIDLLDQIASHSETLHLNHLFLSIIQKTLHYLEHKNTSNSKDNSKNSTNKLLTKHREKWENILQRLQGLIYSEHHPQNKPNFQQKIQNLYDTLNSMLQNALQNMEVEI